MHGAREPRGVVPLVAIRIAALGPAVSTHSGRATDPVLRPLIQTGPTERLAMYREDWG